MDPNTSAIYIDIVIGVSIILIGTIIYIGLLLYKKRRKRKDLESDLETIKGTESPPRKTAADHLGELKEATQKVLQPLRNSSTISLSAPKLSLNLNSDKSSNSSIGAKNSNIIIPLKSYKKPPPPPPPPSPLRTQNDVEVDPIRMSMLNLLLSNTSKTTFLRSENSANSQTFSSPSKVQSHRLSHKVSRRTSRKVRRTSRRTSRRASRVQSRVGSKASDLTLPSKRDLTPPSQTSSRLDMADLTLPSKRDLTPSSQTSSQLDMADLTLPSKTRSKRDLTPPRTTSQLASTLPSETSSKRGLTPPSPILPSGTQSKRSNRKLRFHSLYNKETNDYTNFQPIQNIKPIQSAQLEKQITPAEITEVGELTLSPMYNTVKTISKESQDDEVILDATGGIK